MLVIVTYDVCVTSPGGSARLRKVAKTCLNYGIRAQKSVFECNVSPQDWEFLKDELLNLYNPEEDSLRFYFLGSNWKRRVEHHGLKPLFEHDEPMII